MTVKRMDNVLIVVDDLEAVKAFFIELGLKLEGETTVEGPLVGRLIGLKDVRATLAMMRTPDGQGIELDKFHTPNAIRFGPVDAPVNTLGIRRIMFTVDDIDAVVARMRVHGAELIGEMQYEDTYRLAYIRGPEGIIVALAEQPRPLRRARRITMRCSEHGHPATVAIQAGKPDTHRPPPSPPSGCRQSKHGRGGSGSAGARMP